MVTVIGDFNQWDKRATPMAHARSLGDLGGVRAGRLARREIQIPRHLPPSRLPRRQGRSVRLLGRDAAAARLGRLGSRLRLVGRRLACCRAAASSRSTAPMSIYEIHLGSWRRVPNEGNRFLTYREMAPLARRAHAPHGLHPRRDAPGHGTSVLRFLGLSVARLLRPLQPLRHAAGSDVSDRLSPSAGDRRHPRLGALALPGRRARPRLLRRHPSLRARRSAQGLSPRLVELHLQLRPQRGAELPDQQRPLLAGEVSRRCAAGGRRRLDALSRLLAQGGGVDPQRARRPREPGGDLAACAR